MFRAGTHTHIHRHTHTHARHPRPDCAIDKIGSDLQALEHARLCERVCEVFLCDKHLCAFSFSLLIYGRGHATPHNTHLRICTRQSDSRIQPVKPTRYCNFPRLYQWIARAMPILFSDLLNRFDPLFLYMGAVILV